MANKNVHMHRSPYTRTYVGTCIRRMTYVPTCSLRLGRRQAALMSPAPWERTCCRRALISIG